MAPVDHRDTLFSAACSVGVSMELTSRFWRAMGFPNIGQARPPRALHEIGERAGLSSTGSVAYHLDRREGRGLISCNDRRWRSCRLSG